MMGLSLSLGVNGYAPAVSAVEQNIFDQSTLTIAGSNEIGTAVTLGVVFTASVAGEVRSVDFWKSADDAATARSVAVYSSIGALLASGSSTGESAGPGWVSINLSSAVAITPLTLYVAAVHYPSGGYPASVGVFSSPVVNGDVIAESEAGSGGAQGRWKYGASIAYPDGNGGGTSYGVDISFFAS